MNKRLILALSIFTASLTVNVDSAIAQDTEFQNIAQQDLTAEQKATKQVQRLTKALSLTTDQANQIKLLLLELNQKREGMRDASDKRVAMKEMRDLVSAQDDKMKTILSEEQFSKYEDIKNESKDRMRGKKGGRN